jgi:DNA repair protein RadA/Sms
LHEAGHSCLIASGEEARGQVAARARRLGLGSVGLRFVPGRELPEVVGAALAERPAVLVVDSIQTIRDPDSESLPGGPGQVRGSADALIGLAKEHGITVVLVGHVTKEGDLAGPRTLEHAVDAVLTFEGDPRSGLRVLAGGKNRYGPEGEMVWFEMGASGLVERAATARIGETGDEPGCATALPLAGRRAFAVDVQALVVPSEGPPRRQVTGLDPRRFHIVAAVTDRARDLRFVRAEIFGATAGGVRVDDPAADLAVAAALASASNGVPVPPRTGFVGEISLTGAVRSASGLEQRLSAAVGAGLETVLLNQNGGYAAPHPRGLRVIDVGHIGEALTWAFRRRRPSRSGPTTTHV